jgi:hypothetical protein
VFRELNNRLRDFQRRIDASRSSSFVCECSNIQCVMVVVLPIAEYAEVRAHPTRFLVLDGHEDESIERIIERRSDYLIVEKPISP